MYLFYRVRLEEIFMNELTIPLSSASGIPLYEQIYRFIVSEIHEGRLKQGARLPSKRALCAHLNVSLSTVETAYGLLLAEGYIISRPKSGYYAASSGLPDVRHAAVQSTPACPAAAPPLFDASTSAVDTSAFPYATWAKIFKQVLYDRPDLLSRGDPQGDIELREVLASFLYQYRGVRCQAGQIVVCAGMEHLIEVLIRLTEPSASAAFEDPGYDMPGRIFREYGRAVYPIPVDSSGLNVNALRKTDASLVYVTPSHQFPTGALMPFARRMQLLSWAGESPDRLIIEDDYDSEFRYNSRPVPALQGLSHANNVVYAGTFSRTIAPSIRIAYMVLPDALMNRYLSGRSASSSLVSRFEQQTLARFLQGGYYARHLRRVGNIYRARCAELSRALRRLEGVSVAADDAGLHFLVSHSRLTESEMTKRAAARGIILRGLSEYCHSDASASSTVVMGFAGLSDGQIPEFAALLEEAWRE